MPQDDFRTKLKVLRPKRIFGARAGCGDVTSLYKNLVKNRKTNFRRQAIQGPIFSVANTDFEGGCDGRGRGVRHFFGQIGPTQPCHAGGAQRVLCGCAYEYDAVYITHGWVGPI